MSNQTLSLPALWRKAWLWHLLFSFTWTLRKWTHFHTFQTLCAAQYAFTTHVTSSSKASANGYHTREFWRASIHSEKKKKKNTPQTVKFRNILKSLLWSPAISAITPVCSCSKYFLRVTHVRTVAVSPARLIYPPLLHCSGVCLHDTFHTSNKKKKMEKRRACLNNGRRRYAALLDVAGRGGMRNVKQMSGSSVLPEMVHVCVCVSWEKGQRDNNLLARTYRLHNFEYIYIYVPVYSIWIYMHRSFCLQNIYPQST